MCRACEEEPVDRGRRWLRRGLIVCLLGLAAMFVRDWIRSAERVRELENDYTALAYEYANKDLALIECREAQVASRERAKPLAPVKGKR